MIQAPNVLVRDKQTGHEYYVSERRFKASPELWDRLSTKPRTTVDEAAARKTQGDALIVTPPPELTEPLGSPEDVHPNPGDEEGHTSGHPADSNQEES